MTDETDELFDVVDATNDEFDHRIVIDRALADNHEELVEQLYLDLDDADGVEQAVHEQPDVICVVARDLDRAELAGFVRRWFADHQEEIDLDLALDE